MGHAQLNHVAICNICKHELKDVDMEELAEEFSEKTDIHRNIFGNFQVYILVAFQLQPPTDI